MSPYDDRGGDPPCWAHLADEPERDIGEVADVDEFVRAFYRRAATDVLLGPIFEAAEIDWAAHIPKLIDFWSWQLLGVPGYEGNPLTAHRPVHSATPFAGEHYQRWLDIFNETIDERFAGPVSSLAKLRAAKMAAAMHRLLDGTTSPPFDSTSVTLRSASA